MNFPFSLSKLSTKKLNFIDLHRQRDSRNSSGVNLAKLINKNIKSVFDHGQYIVGPEVGQLEERLKNFTGSKHALGVSSGTDGLLIAL